MKKLILILLVITTVSYGQRPNNNGQGSNSERIKSLKIAHITEELDLTSSEAEKFWPIYNEYNDAMMAIRKEQRGESNEKLRKEGIDALTDKDANILIDKMLAMKTTELNYKKELISNLKGVLAPKKIIKLQQAERSFKEKLLKRLKDLKRKRE
jgi:Spy/CpxP family protein refolding chaperone